MWKQSRARYWLGGIKHSIGQIGIYISFINLFLLSITAYNTGWIQQFVSINFITFILVVAGIIVLLMLSVYRLDMPSYFGFWKQQVGLDKIEEKQQLILKRQELIMRKLGISDADITDK
jgi:uncharacterized membrane protein YhaH (DUF805 family)